MSSLNMASSGPGLWTGIPSEDDQRLREVGIAALAALAQNPPLREEDEHVVVDQVVAAVSGNNQPRLQSSAIDMETSDKTPDSDANRLRRLESPETDQENTNTSTPSDQGDTSVARRFAHSFGNSGDDDGASDTEMADTWQRPNQRIETELNSLMLHRRTQNMPLMDYDATVETYASSPASGPEEDIEEMLKFYPGEEDYFRRRNPSIPGTQSTQAPRGNVDLGGFYSQAHYADTEDEFEGLGPEDTMSDPDLVEAVPFLHTNIFEHNHTIDEFIERWLPVYESQCLFPDLRRSIMDRINQMSSWMPERLVLRPDKTRLHDEEFFDLQQIPWKSILGVSRKEARATRDQWYTSYHNVRRPGILSQGSYLPETELQFREQAMYNGATATIEHFQLRNLMSVPYHDTVHFANDSKIYSTTPSLGTSEILINLSHPDIEAGFFDAVKIPTMKSQHGLVVAGGFCGEYAFKPMNAEGDGAKGRATPNFNDGIINHVDIIPNRTGPSPNIVFSCNDRHLRILDTQTNIFTFDKEMSNPINCTASSPDGRLRVIIGDSPDAWVMEADTGRPVQRLSGHRDFGFACAWSPDMRHIATSNQDKTLKIWDARTWRVLETIESDVAGYRSLRFSPVGGGPRSLLCVEPADRISIINAQTYQTRQVHTFFGEIGGADFSPDGGDIWVANTDPHFCGLMHYQRYQWGARYGLADTPNEWLRDDELDHDDRSLYTSRERSLRFLRALDDAQYDQFVL